MATITKRKGKNGLSFRIRVCIGTTDNNNPIQKSMTWKPPAKMTERQAEKQAQREADKFEELIRKGINTDKMTFQKLSELYIADIKKTQKPRAVSSHKDRLKRINSMIGHLEVKNINSQHIRQFIADLEKPIIQKNGTEKVLASATIHGFIRTVSCVLSFGCQQDYITENVCLGKRIKKPKLDEGKDKMIQPEVLNGYMKVLENSPVKYKTFFKIALGTGMRMAEILGLRWKDVDFDEHTLSINETRSYVPETGTIFVQPKTANSQRTVAVTEQIINALRELKVIQSEERLKAGALWKKNPENPVEEYCENHHLCNRETKNYCSKRCSLFKQEDRIFVNEIGLPMSDTAIRKHIQKAGEAAGLPHITIHGLRHSAVSILINNHEPLPSIAAFVGHANTQTTTRVYAHAIKQSANTLSSSIEGYLKTTDCDIKSNI